jgi:hypothetical protein
LLSRRNLKKERLVDYLIKDKVELLQSVSQSRELSVLCGGNAHQVRQLRESFTRVADEVAAVLKGGRR